MEDQLCPCGSGRSFDDCCNRMLTGKRFAVTAEELMRSRYSAFATENGRYLLDTWHPSTRPPELDFEASPEWRGLEIINTTGGQQLDSTGTVHFIAHYEWRGQSGKRDENSRFEKLNGLWYYVDGDIES